MGCFQCVCLCMYASHTWNMAFKNGSFFPFCSFIHSLSSLLSYIFHLEKCAVVYRQSGEILAHVMRNALSIANPSSMCMSLCTKWKKKTEEKSTDLRVMLVEWACCFSKTFNEWTLKCRCKWEFVITEHSVLGFYIWAICMRITTNKN